MRKLIFLGMLSAILAPGAALSLGLGDIRLNSYLNQPMDAEIALSLTSPDELNSLRIELAPQDVFRQYGVDRPAYFDELRFRVRSTGRTTAVVEVSSTSPMIEPFLTFLIEARWSGGRMVREYTVLLDPPVFMPEPAAGTAPAQARPPAVDAPRQAPAPVSRPAPAPAPAAGSVSDYGSEYSVRRNDTLWAIAQQVRPDPALTTNQVMIALFRENPHAFDGNINRLRAGTILRVPSRQQMAAASGGEATAEVRRQTEEWRAAAPAPADRRLELAPPAEIARPPAPVSAPVREPVAAPAPELLGAVEELRGELAETRRLMEVKDAEIAALQARLAEMESDATPAAPAAAPVEAEPAPAAAPEPAPRPAPEAAAPAPAPAPAPTVMDRVFAALGSLWLWLVLAVVLIAAAVGVFLNKRKDQERSIEEDLAETGTWGTLEGTGGKLAAAGAGMEPGKKIETRARRGENLDSFLVEETESPAPREKPKAPEAHVAPPAAPPDTEAAGDEDFQYPFEDTIAGEAGINLDQSDPMAEADFHMAYGLYDQAAEIIKKAVEREPDRYDLRRKLIDICFVWGNADEFLAQAEAIRGLKDANAAADWAKISIMGRQICPGEPMFAGTGAPAVDLDLGSEDPAATASGEEPGSNEEWLDFDVGESDESLQALGDTREQPVPGLESVSPEHTAELNLEELGMDLDLGESGEHALQDLAERAPEFLDELEDESGEATPDDATLRLPGQPDDDDADAEPAAEEDVSGTQMLDAAKIRRAGEEPTQRGEGWELAEDEPTLSGLGGFEEDGDDQTLVSDRDSIGGEETVTGLGDFEADDGDASDRTLIKKFEPSHEAPTMEVGGFEEDDEGDLGLDELTQSVRADLDDARDEPVEQTQQTPKLETDEAAEQELDDTAEMAPAAMDEVGTKLDLARAYIDMGDPDGARSILEEVVEEGEEAQRDEARQLLDSLD